MDGLNELMNAQRKLHERFLPIESSHGLGAHALLFTQLKPHQHSHESFNNHRFQAAIKDYAQRITEEIVEASFAPTDELRQEEIIDALHFYLEVCTVAGITSEELKVKRFPTSREQDDALSLFICATAESNSEGDFDYQCWMTVRSLCCATHELKSRPWYPMERESCRHTFIHFFTDVLSRLFSLLQITGITNADELFAAYNKKNAENVNRITTGTRQLELPLEEINGH